jgi:hypothetical protein
MARLASPPVDVHFAAAPVTAGFPPGHGRVVLLTHSVDSFVASTCAHERAQVRPHGPPHRLGQLASRQHRVTAGRNNTSAR